MPEFGWLLLVEQREHIGDQRIESALLINIGVSLLVTAIVGVAVYVTIRNYQRRLENLASRDKLTGASNRQVFDLVFADVARGCKRRNETLGVICIDLDEFKSVNDAFGHPGGDATLREIATTIRRHIRDTDTLCRWGGDEFILLIPGYDRRAALTKAREIADAVRETPVRFGRDDIHTTISAGVTEYRDGEDFDTLITRVDNALYSAKSAGRDHISMA